MQRYFLDSIYLNQGYNLINTVTYGIIALAALYIIYKVFQKIKFKIDFNLLLAAAPFIVLGSSLRAFVDNGFYQITFWTVSPGIYLVVAAVFLVILFGSFLLEQKSGVPYWQATFLIGLAYAVTNFAFVWNRISWEGWLGGLAVIALAVLVSALLWTIFFRLDKKIFLEKINFAALSAHMLDASSTFIAVDFFGGVEEHPIPSLVSGFFGTGATQFFLKLIVLIPAIWYINKEMKDTEARNYLLIVIAVLGFAQGLRNLLSVAI